MARKIASTTRRSSKALKAAKVITTVAALVGYDPTLLLAAPAPALPVEALPAMPNAAEYAMLEAFLAQQTVETPALNADAVIEEVLETPIAAEEGAVPFAMQLALLDEADISLGVRSIAQRFADRSAYEADKNPDNLNIQRTLRKAKAELTAAGAAAVLLACNVDEGFIDRQSREGNRYNVYAIDKVADLVGFMRGNPSLNRINAAVLRSMLRFEAAGVEFTMELAKAAASDKIRVEPRYRALLASHTVSASTAPTQASSTMQALQTLGIVIASGGARNPTYRFAEGAQVDALRERLGA